MPAQESAVHLGSWCLPPALVLLATPEAAHPMSNLQCLTSPLAGLQSQACADISTPFPEQSCESFCMDLQQTVCLPCRVEVIQQHQHGRSREYPVRFACRNTCKAAAAASS